MLGKIYEISNRLDFVFIFDPVLKIKLKVQKHKKKVLCFNALETDSR